MVSCGGSTTNLSPCGTVAPSGAYTPPQKVPAANGFVVQATANADPSKMTTSGSISIGSTVTVSVSIVQGSIQPPATNTVAVGFSLSLQAAVGNDPNNLGVMNWSVNGIPGGNSTVGTIMATDSTHATYTAPAAVPSPATVNITAASVADFNKMSTQALQIVSDQMVYDPTNSSNTVAIPSGLSSGTFVIDLQGVPNAPASAFACTSFGPLTGAACSFVTNNQTSTCPAAQCTVVTLTLSVIRTAALLPPSSPNTLAGLNSVATFMLLLPLAVFGLMLSQRPRTSEARIKHAFAFVLLLCLSLGWVAACGQFAQPGPPPPPTGGAVGAMGNLTVTATPTGNSTTTVLVPYNVSP